MILYLVRWNGTGHTALLSANDEEHLAKIVFEDQPPSQEDEAIFIEFDAPITIEFGRPGGLLPKAGASVGPPDQVSLFASGLSLAQGIVGDDDRSHILFSTNRDIVGLAFPKYCEAFEDAMEVLCATLDWNEARATSLPLRELSPGVSPENDLEVLRAWGNAHRATMLPEVRSALLNRLQEDLRSTPEGWERVADYFHP